MTKLKTKKRPLYAYRSYTDTAHLYNVPPIFLIFSVIYIKYLWNSFGSSVMCMLRVSQSGPLLALFPLFALPHEPRGSISMLTLKISELVRLLVLLSRCLEFGKPSHIPHLFFLMLFACTFIEMQFICVVVGDHWNFFDSLWWIGNFLMDCQGLLLNVLLSSLLGVRTPCQSNWRWLFMNVW